ncbi:MAG: hypothetical protein QXP77_02570 [Candidatus Aenigmatarchaeota archaeon]
MSYEKIEEGYKRIKEISRGILSEKEGASIFVYLVDKSLSSKGEGLVGLIIPPEDYSEILKFALVRDAYMSKSEKKLIGIDVEAENPKEIIEFGLRQEKYGKIIRKDGQLYLTQEEKLKTSTAKMGVNVTANIVNALKSLKEGFEEMTKNLRKRVNF